MKIKIKNLRNLIREALETTDVYAKTEMPQDMRYKQTVKVNKPDSIGVETIKSMHSDTPVEQKTKLVAKELQKQGKPIKINDLLKFMKAFNEDDLMINTANWFAKEFLKKTAN
jgi:hypothetical protein